MSSILDLEADGSSDENDFDYVPPSGGKVSTDTSDEDSCDDLKESPQTPKSIKRNAEKYKTPEKSKSEVSEIPSSVESLVDEKKRAADIWSDFLSDVSTPDCKNKNFPIKCVENKSVASNGVGLSSTKELVNGSKAKIFEFAGEQFKISNHGSESLVPSHTREPETSSVIPKKRGGLESVLGNISKSAKKLTTLEKTLMDWKSYKLDEGLDNDLEKYNKGRNGFLERKRFLERSDIRSFQIEKSMRQSKRKK